MIILVLFSNNLSYHAYILINYVLLYSYNYYIILVILVFLDKFNVHGYLKSSYADVYHRDKIKVYYYYYYY